MIKNLVDELPMVSQPLWDKAGLVQFERKMADHWEAGKVRGPIHLSGGNEEELIEIFKYVKKTDWVFSTWRSHYHALLKGIPSEWLENEILEGRSITIVNQEHKFYSSAIVGAIIPIATGVALANKRDGKDDKVWCFIGDMALKLAVSMKCTNTHNDMIYQFVLLWRIMEFQQTHRLKKLGMGLKEKFLKMLFGIIIKKSGRTTEQENGLFFKYYL
jgi:hypothetical protein